MIAAILQGAAVSALSWIVWKLFIQQSPLDNIPGPPAQSWLYGNLLQFVDRNGWGFLEHLTEYGPVSKVYGMLGRRELYIFDPLAMHHVVVKDQHIFEEAAWFIRSNDLLFGPGLLATLGDHHRQQRKLLNPVFSISHMRRMIPIFNAISHKLQEAIETRVVASNPAGTEVDVLAWMGRTALELVGQAGLGYSFDPLVSDSEDEYGAAIKAVQPVFSRVNHLRRIFPYLPRRMRGLQRWLLDRIPSADVQRAKALADTMHRNSVRIFEEKKKALVAGDEKVTRQVGEGKDIMSILMRANMEASEEDRMPDTELIGQMSTLIFAAMDTTSNALSIILELLAEHPDVQGKLRKEILEASCGEDLGYDSLVSLPYLDAVCRETLRLHSPVSLAFRDSRAEAVVPLSEPVRGKDGKMMYEVHVPRNTTVWIGILASNRNKALWGEDALEWKPERWLKPLPETVTDAKIPGVYANLMTFLGGGRACIGFKFSQLEMKVVLCALLSKFTFKKCPNKEIIWNLSGIRFPSVAGQDDYKASLPLMVGLYKPTA